MHSVLAVFIQQVDPHVLPMLLAWLFGGSVWRQAVRIFHMSQLLDIPKICAGGMATVILVHPGTYW